MKIVVISDNYPSEGWPMYVFVEQLVNELVSLGVDIEVIAPQSLTAHYLRHTPLLPKYSLVTIGSGSYSVHRPYYISMGNCSNWLHRILDYFRYQGIKRVLDRSDRKPDALYGHFWHNAFVARQYAYDNNIPMFVACGEGDNALEDLVAMMSSVEKDKFSNAVKGVISVSSENKRKCIEYGLAKAEDIAVLPNSVDTKLFSMGNYDNKREQLGVTEEDFLIAFTGAFIHRKGSARLAEAVDKLNDPHIKVMFIGKNRPADDATPSCQGIVWKGGLEHNEIPDFLKSADVFCLPTLNEGCSNAIVEALACGLPVISSNLPFNLDVLDETDSILIDPMNVDEISAAITLLKENKELRKKLSEGALRKAESLRLDVRARKIKDFIDSKLAIL